MADEQLRSLVQKMIDDGAEDGTIQEVIKKYKEKQGSLSMGEKITEVGKGVGAELKDQAVGAWETAKAVGGSVMRGNLNPSEIASDVAQRQAGALAASGEGMSALDPTGVSQIVKRDESGWKKGGRGAVLAAETLIPFLRIGKGGAAVKTTSKVASTTGKGGAGFGRTVMDVPKDLSIAPAPTKFSVGRPVAKPEAAVTGTASAARGMRATVPASQRPNQFSLRVPVKEPVAKAPVATGAAEVSPANAAMKAEAAAEAAAAGRTEAPGRPPVYSGPERRSPSRVAGAAEDRAYRDMRKKIEEKAAKERAKAMLTGSKKVEAPLPKETDVPPAPKASAEVPKEVGAKKGVLAGFTRQPTKSLAQMVAEYGEQGAATRAGMSVDELKIRIEAGGDPAKLAKGLRDKFGADKAARLLGESADKVRKESGGGPSRLPDRAVEGIKAAAERELKANGVVSEKTQKLLERIKAERGAASGRALLVGGGAVGGGIAGSMIGAKNNDERIGNTVLGAVGGAGLGLLPGRMGRAAHIANQIRREAFLTGGAIPKNILTAAGAPLRAAFEGVGSSRGAAAKEMFLKPGTNAASFWNHLKQAPIKKNPNDIHLGRFAPSKFVGAIDDTARDALKRAGVPHEQIDRYLLTANRNLFDYLKRTTPGSEQVIDFAFPFQKVPTNVLAEGARELGHTLTHADMRTAINVLQAGGAYGLGQWAKGDKKRKYIASILLAFAGPNALLSVGAAAQGAGLSGFAAQSLGGTSPIPEQAFDPKSFLGFKPAAVSAIQRLGGK